MSQLPLRSSEVVQRVHVPFMRTYSAHSLEEMNSQLASYHSRNNDTLREDDLSQNSLASNGNAMALPGDVPIDKVSPDENERVAKEALRDKLSI